MSDADSNTFVSRSQAARILGIPESELDPFVTTGYLIQIDTDDGPGFLRHEVIRLMEQRDSGMLPTVSQEAMLKLFAELRDIRETLDAVLSILGIGQRPLSLEPTQLAVLYRNMITALGQETYSRQELEDWSRILLRIRDGHIAAMTSISHNDRPWELVYRLSERLCQWLAGEPAVTENVYLRSLFFQLEAAREHIRNVCLSIHLMDPGRDYRTRLARTIPDLDEILAEVARGKGFNAIPPLAEVVLMATGRK